MIDTKTLYDWIYYESNPSILSVHPGEVIEVSRFNAKGIRILLENCLKIHEFNTKVNTQIISTHTSPYIMSAPTSATLSPYSWFPDVIDILLDSISYVVTEQQFYIHSIVDSTLLSTVYECDLEKVDSIDKLKEFIEERGKSSMLGIFNIYKSVDLVTLSEKWIIWYKEIPNKSELRSKKINSVIVRNSIFFCVCCTGIL